jgi:hypothetical protein
LRNCTALTALDLVNCTVTDADAAAAAIAALPDLRHLGSSWICEEQTKRMLRVLQFPTQLTYLNLCCEGWLPEAIAQLSQLSGLVNLQDLQLVFLPTEGVPGGVPSQLCRLTNLSVMYHHRATDTAEQLQHLSSLTALQDLSLSVFNAAAETLSGIQHLSRLTGIDLESNIYPRDLYDALEFSTASTRSWGQLTALQSLFPARLLPAATGTCGLHTVDVSNLMECRVLPGCITRGVTDSSGLPVAAV